ncbi:hypothetical protein [Actinotalea subterranea]|uniref:hypothetical protein n=1 Tax=Actinotalea subterranea TaxID=2607497 RepID=UPI0011ED7351|nr:hypothetical protein [Actinotalea subterranea]
MKRNHVRMLAVELAFSLVVVLTAELVVQSTGWHRFWVLLVAMVTAYTLRGVVQTAVSRRAAGRPDAAPRRTMRDHTPA